MKSDNQIKLYLDTCSYNRPFDNQNQLKIQFESSAKLYIQNEIRKGTYELIWSFMLDFENNDNPHEENRKSIQVWENIATEFCDSSKENQIFSNLKKQVFSSKEILKQGKKLQKIGIKENDALHIACAIFANCSYFITTDYKLINKEIDEIKIINPIDFIKIMEL